MKKYLIALPLVLIMILSMVPVMAANKTVNVPVTYYKTPEKKDVLRTETRAIEVDEAILTDKAKLEAAVEAAIKALGFPALDTDVQPAWTVKATAKAQTQADTTYDIATTPYTEGIKMVDLVAWAEKNKVTVSVTGVSQDDWDEKPFASAGMMTKVNAEIQKVAAGEEPAELKVNPAVDMVKDAPKNDSHKLAYLVPKAGAVSEAEVTAIAYPNCFVDPKTEEETFCPELCEFITVKVVNAFNGKEIVSAAKKYKVDPKKLPTFKGIYDHYMNNYFPGGYKIMKNWDLRDSVRIPSAIDKDCTITIYVLPAVQFVDVVHVLKNCCETPDGTMSYPVWKTFYEPGVTVDFIEYHSTFVVDSKKAGEWAATRLQKINATDFVFEYAHFDDGIVLDNYMTGEVYDMAGNKITTITDTNPTIILEYVRAECVKEEEQVDNATVENNANTQAPVTASGTQLPATGAKDVTAFFLSAVALLGLGIFFAKKH